MPMDGSDLVEPTTQCPLKHGVRFHTSFGGRSNRDWWPNQLNLKLLSQHSSLTSPLAPTLVPDQAGDARSATGRLARMR